MRKNIKGNKNVVFNFRTCFSWLSKQKLCLNQPNCWATVGRTMMTSEVWRDIRTFLEFGHPVHVQVVLARGLRGVSVFIQDANNVVVQSQSIGHGEVTDGAFVVLRDLSWLAAVLTWWTSTELNTNGTRQTHQLILACCLKEFFLSPRLIKSHPARRLPPSSSWGQRIWPAGSPAAGWICLRKAQTSTGWWASFTSEADYLTCTVPVPVARTLKLAV